MEFDFTSYSLLQQTQLTCVKFKTKSVVLKKLFFFSIDRKQKMGKPKTLSKKAKKLAKKKGKAEYCALNVFTKKCSFTFHIVY